MALVSRLLFLCLPMSGMDRILVSLSVKYSALSLSYLTCVIVSKLRLMEEPAAYGKFGLANLLELREECLREFQFVDAYISIKQRLASSLYMYACTQTALIYLIF
jgi:hypothetical protein